MSNVIDISKHQGDIDFSKVKAAGVKGVICRCAYGGSKDVKFDEYVSAAHALDIPVGAYSFATWHYSSKSNDKATATENALNEVNKVIAILKDINITGPVALDLELESKYSISLSKEDLTEIANIYMQKLEQAGYKPLLYASISWYYERMTVNNINYPLWVAYFHDSGLTSTDFPNTSYGSKMVELKNKIWLWQYSSKGDGSKYGTQSTYVDLNHIYIDNAFQNSDNTNQNTGTVNTGTTNTNSSTTTAKTNVSQKTVATVKYKVVKNDTMSSIAKKYGITLKDLISANQQIKNINLIYVGQVINIPKKSAVKAVVSSKIKVGDKVKVKKGSKTYTGGSIASFVFNNIYTVDELKGDRAVLDLKGIATPVNINNLIKIK